MLARMIVILLPVLVVVVGLLVFALAANPKPAEIGRILFGCGALVATYLAAGVTIWL